MSQQTQERAPLNGVDTPSLFATINAVKDNRELAKFKRRASNKWIKGTKSRGTVEKFDGAGGVHEHKKTYEYDADHPAVLCGEDEGPTPIEFLLVALTSCITSGIANIAAARGVTLSSVEPTRSVDSTVTVPSGSVGASADKGTSRQILSHHASGYKRAGELPRKTGGGGLRLPKPRVAGSSPVSRST